MIRYWGMLLLIGAVITSMCGAESAAPENMATGMDSIVASVDGVPISLGDILPACREQEIPLYASRGGQELYDAIREVRRKALDELIDRKLILADFERTEPFKIPPQIVESYLDDLALNAGIRSRSQFAAKVRESGMTIEELRKQAREQLIIQAMRSRRSYIHVNVTPREVHDYFVAHPEQFGTPEAWSLSMILIAKDAADRDAILKEIAGRLAGGGASDFAEMASAYSSGPNAATGGALGAIERTSLRHEFAEAIKEPKVGAFYGPVKADEGDYFLMISEIRPAVMPDFRAMAPRIRERLEQERRSAALREYTRQLRSQALIHYYL